MSRSNLRGLQPEVCELCGRAVPQAELFISQVEGLRGRKVCNQHGQYTTAPSYNDINRLGRRLPYADVSRRQPIGGPLDLYSDEFGVQPGDQTWLDDGVSG
jgi:hypothetical protein